MPREQFALRLEKSYFITPHVKHFIFKREDNLPVTFTPGQFMNFHFEHNGETLQRSYSIATRDLNSGMIEVAISEVKEGLATAFFFNMMPGQTIMASGPYGKLVLHDDPLIKRYIFVATNTGITPYRSMLSHLNVRLESDPHFQVVILQGVRTPPELLYREELIEFAQGHENANFYAFYTREQPETAAHFERQGRVQTLFPALNLQPEHDIVYLCGNPDMVDEAFSLLKEAGFQNNHVRREKYVFSH